MIKSSRVIKRVLLDKKKKTPTTFGGLRAIQRKILKRTVSVEQGYRNRFWH